MKIILHGATDRGSTNFGDFLYANELYSLCRSMNAEVCYYNESAFIREYTRGYCANKFTVQESDLLVYIPGGYFSEAHDTTLKRCLINFRRYMPFGLSGCVRRKRIAVLGIGAGNIHTPFLRWPLKWILNHAEMITVRDEISRKALDELKPKSSPENYGDLILSIDIPSLIQATQQTQEIGKQVEGKKLVVVHYNHSRQALQLFAAALQVFKDTHPEYQLVVTTDSVIEDDMDLFDSFKNTVGRCIHFTYKNPYELIELLRISDVVVTCKLHLGVVACMLGKSVISVAEDYAKTSRFYEQIGETNRCVPLNESDAEQVSEMINRFCEKKVTIPQALIEESNKHRERLMKLVQIIKK